MISLVIGVLFVFVVVFLLMFTLFSILIWCGLLEPMFTRQDYIDCIKYFIKNPIKVIKKFFKEIKRISLRW